MIGRYDDHVEATLLLSLARRHSMNGESVIIWKALDGLFWNLAHSSDGAPN